MNQSKMPTDEHFRDIIRKEESAARKNGTQDWPPTTIESAKKYLLEWWGEAEATDEFAGRLLEMIGVAAVYGSSSCEESSGVPQNDFLSTIIGLPDWVKRMCGVSSCSKRFSAERKNNLRLKSQQMDEKRSMVKYLLLSIFQRKPNPVGDLTKEKQL